MSNAAEQNVQAVLSPVGLLRAALKRSFAERNEVIDGTLVGLLAKENVFLLGPPGTAKSALSLALCNALSGNYFNWLISKVTTPDELFGPISINGIKNSTYERVTAHKLPEADIAFLDEIFKGSSAILNTLLPIMNERTFYNGPKPTKMSLQMIIGASNEIPSSEELGAMFDRFALKYEVDRIKSDAAMEDLLLNGIENNQVPNLTMEQLAAEQTAAMNVKVSADLVKVILQLRQEIHQQGYLVSDRKWRQALKLIKAFAYLNGRTEATNEDLEILEHVLWSEPGQRKEIKRIIAKVSNPLGETIMKVLDAVNVLVEQVNAGKTQATDALHKIKTADKQLQKAGDPETNAKLKDALDQISKLRKKLIQDHLGDVF